MKKQVVCTLAAALAVTSLSAFAANPFVDVPTDSWAYQSVVELADAGIIQGVDGQYFQGHRNITRYEAAEMVAKAMAHMDKASVEQRALINKLADEYADELNSLGVRVTNLENRVGNTRVFGDVFVRYRYQNGNKKDDSSWDTRFRIRAQGQVNDRTKVTAGVSTGFRPFASNGAASDESNNPYVDLAKVDYNFGGKNWELSVGRNDVYRIGRDAYGLQYFDALDGAELRYHNDKLAITTGYGKFKDGKKPGVDTIHASQAYSNAFSTSGLETGYGEIDAFFGGGKAARSEAGFYYNRLHKTNDLAPEFFAKYVAGYFVRATTANGAPWPTTNTSASTKASRTSTARTTATPGWEPSSTAKPTSTRPAAGMPGWNTSTSTTAPSWAATPLHGASPATWTTSAAGASVPTTSSPRT